MRNVTMKKTMFLAVLVILVVAAQPAAAAYLEPFDAGTAGYVTRAGVALSNPGAGGNPGGYLKEISTTGGSGYAGGTWAKPPASATTA